MMHQLWTEIAEKMARRIKQLEATQGTPGDELLKRAEAAGIRWAWEELVRTGAVPNDMTGELRLMLSLLDEDDWCDK
jgi:hypothetical protein